VGRRSNNAVIDLHFRRPLGARRSPSFRFHVRREELQAARSWPTNCESALESRSCSNRQHCIERNHKKLVDRGSPSAPIGTPAAADSVIRHKDLLTLLQEVYFDADSQ